MTQNKFHIEYHSCFSETRDYLYEGDKYWMDDGIEEIEIHQRVADRCKGKVLIGGLGLGLIVNMLLKNKEVTKIIVVEKEQEVFDLVKSRLNIDWSSNYKEKIEFKIMDMKTYVYNTRERFDYVYIDIVPVASPKSYATTSLPLKKKA